MPYDFEEVMVPEHCAIMRDSDIHTESNMVVLPKESRGSKNARLILKNAETG